MKLLVVEDNERLSAALESVLTQQGLEAVCARNGEEAIEALDQEPDAVLLDLGLPDCDGFALCARIRASSPVPILVTSARADHASCVRGLDLGADDYLVKPYNLAEVLARVRAVMRRARPAEPLRLVADRAAPNDLILAGPVRIDVRERIVLVSGYPVELSDEEFSILAALAERPGQVVRLEQLVEALVRGTLAALQGAVHGHVASLSRSLGAADLVEAVDGAGYRLAVSGAA